MTWCQTWKGEVPPVPLLRDSEDNHLRVEQRLVWGTDREESEINSSLRRKKRGKAEAAAPPVCMWSNLPPSHPQKHSLSSVLSITL
jgi:hypothetical protein